jgi:hypothetical protein
MATAVAQQSSTLIEDPFDSSALPPLAAKEAKGQAPRLRFDLVAEIALPGPLPGGQPQQQAGGRVASPGAGGTALTEARAGAVVELRAADPASEAAAAENARVPDPAGRLHFSAADGVVLAERRCRRCPSGWRKAWRLAAPVDAGTRPLALADRVCFGGLDNRVFCVRRKNGHRLWATDVGARASRPLALWQGVLPPATDREKPRTVDVILVVPEPGQELLALDAESGVKLGEVKLADEEGHWSGVPLQITDGAVVVGRTKYAEEEASLMVYRLVPLPPEVAPVTAALSSSGPPPASVLR